MTRTLQDKHTEHLYVFREVTGVEQALYQQIVTVVKPQYLEVIRDPTT